jgi:uncharacterized protein involved in exopolysaccharide biosynthesis
VGVDALLAAVRRGWWVLLFCAVMAGTVTYAGSSDQPAEYQSTTRFVLAPATLPETRELIDTSAALEDRSIVTTFAEVMTSTRILAQASKDPSLAAVRPDEYTRSTAALPAANVVELTVTGPHPGRARMVAAVVARLSTEYFQSLYSIYRVDILDAPSLSAAPVEPKPVRDAALGTFGGLMLGLALVVGSRGRPERDGAEPRAADPVSDLVRLDDGVRDADGAPRARRARVAAGTAESEG